MNHGFDFLGNLWVAVSSSSALLKLWYVSMIRCRRRSGFQLVIFGVIIGFLPSNWTVIMPLLSIALVILTIRRARRAYVDNSSAQWRHKTWGTSNRCQKFRSTQVFRILGGSAHRVFVLGSGWLQGTPEPWWPPLGLRMLPPVA